MYPAFTDDQASICPWEKSAKEKKNTRGRYYKRGRFVAASFLAVINASVLVMLQLRSAPGSAKSSAQVLPLLPCSVIVKIMKNYTLKTFFYSDQRTKHLF